MVGHVPTDLPGSATDHEDRLPIYSPLLSSLTRENTVPPISSVAASPLLPTVKVTGVAPFQRSSHRARKDSYCQCSSVAAAVPRRSRSAPFSWVTAIAP